MHYIKGLQKHYCNQNVQIFMEKKHSVWISGSSGSPEVPHVNCGLISFLLSSFYHIYMKESNAALLISIKPFHTKSTIELLSRINYDILNTRSSQTIVQVNPT